MVELDLIGGNIMLLDVYFILSLRILIYIYIVNVLKISWINVLSCINGKIIYSMVLHHLTLFLNDMFQ